MDFSKFNEKEFADYLQSTVRLDALDKMTSALDRELTDSQRMLSEMKAMFESISRSSLTSHPMDSGSRHEDLSKLLEAGVPQLLLPDMDELAVDDLDAILALIKGYAENLKQNLTGTEPQQPCDRDPGPGVTSTVSALHLDHYASSLDQLGKRLVNIKLSKKTDVNRRNIDLEDKLTELCQEINNFTQVVEAKAKLTEHNQNWSETEDCNALHYENIVNKLLCGINEVTYLLNSKN